MRIMTAFLLGPFDLAKGDFNSSVQQHDELAGKKQLFTTLSRDWRALRHGAFERG
jgi:hypothetical protein